MSDDNFRRRNERDASGSDSSKGSGVDFGDEFGVVRFSADDDDDSPPAISFDSPDTDQLPHWTEPATGEVPRFAKTDDTTGTRDSDRTNVWSEYNVPTVPPPVSRPSGEKRIVIGTDPTGERRRASAPRDPSGSVTRSDSSSQVSRGRQPGSTRPPVRRDQRSGASRKRNDANGGANVSRDLPTATAVGTLLLAVFVAAIMWRPAAVMVVVTVVIGFAAFEFFSQATERGYRPPVFIGILGCVAAPLAAYWIGDAALPLIFVFAFFASAVTFVSSESIESGPVPNMAITSLGLTWIGLLGSYAALILRLSTLGGTFVHVGTDTLCILVAGVIGNDIFAFFVGRTAGRTPLRDWISPQKSFEGAIGGALGTIGGVVLVGIRSDTWNSLSEWIALAVVIMIMAPLGDLVESMFKRNLDVKDFGSILKGHGGVLDRFDSLIFTLPAVYYLALVLQPWN